MKITISIGNSRMERRWNRITLTLEELRSFHPAFDADVFDDLSMLACVERRRIPGAPAPDMVQQSIDAGRAAL